MKCAIFSKYFKPLDKLQPTLQTPKDIVPKITNRQADIGLLISEQIHFYLHNFYTYHIKRPRAYFEPCENDNRFDKII